MVTQIQKKSAIVCQVNQSSICLFVLMSALMLSSALLDTTESE